MLQEIGQSWFQLGQINFLPSRRYNTVFWAQNESNVGNTLMFWLLLSRTYSRGRNFHLPHPLTVRRCTRIHNRAQQRHHLFFLGLIPLSCFPCHYVIIIITIILFYCNSGFKLFLSQPLGFTFFFLIVLPIPPSWSRQLYATSPLAGVQTQHQDLEKGRELLYVHMLFHI